MGFVSFAQNNEDVLLHRVFGGQETGFYVDVGAYHPVEGSVTKALYDRGWSGINIEPGSVFEELAAARPRDVNLRMAVMDRQGEIAFMEDARDRGMSHVVDDNGSSLQSVPCDTLENIVCAHGRGRPVDVIKIDAEGAEEAIIRSTNWRRLRPRLLVIEATLPWSNVLSNQAWEPALIEQGYVRAYFDGINCFYVPEEEAHNLLRHFLTPIGVLDGVRSHEFVQIGAARDQLESEISTARSQIEVLKARAKEIEAKDQEIAKYRFKIDELQSRIVDQETLEADFKQSLLAQATEERNRFSRELAAIWAHAQMPLASVDSNSPEERAGSMPRRSRFLRRLARLAYGVVRPVVRPMAWRLRGFMMADLITRLDRMNVRLSTPPISGEPDQTQRETDASGTASLAEMRRIANEMETALLTLAMEAASPQRQPIDIEAEAPPRDAADVTLPPEAPSV